MDGANLDLAPLAPIASSGKKCVGSVSWEFGLCGASDDAPLLEPNGEPLSIVRILAPRIGALSARNRTNNAFSFFGTDYRVARIAGRGFSAYAEFTVSRVSFLDRPAVLLPK